MQEPLPEKTVEASKEPLPSCKDWEHAYPDQNFEVGARVCQICGRKEY